jgi:hypothetical protein
MYVFGNGVVVGIDKTDRWTTVEIQVPSYLKMKNDNGKFDYVPGKVKVTYWAGNRTDAIIKTLKENDTQVLFSAQLMKTKGKNDQWYDNFTGVSLEYASVPTKQRPQKPAPRAPEPAVDEFEDTGAGDDDFEEEIEI